MKSKCHFLLCFSLLMILTSCTNRASYRFESPFVSHTSISNQMNQENLAFLDSSSKDYAAPRSKKTIKTKNFSSKSTSSSRKDAISKRFPSENISSLPKETKQKVKGPLIVLDAGHGGKDTGAKSVKNDYEEKILTMQTVNLLKNYLSKMGYEVTLTRKNDSFVELEKRAEIANDSKAALFVSVHYNYCPNEEAEGVEIFYFKDEKNPYTKRLIESRKLGESVLAGIVKHTGAIGRGVKRANFAVIRETKMPAVLIECGFLSNPDERRRILEIPYRQFLAFGIASGIDRYLSQNQ